MSSDYVSVKVEKAEYAVRGMIAARAEIIKADLAKGKKYPFKSILACNLGNPQALGQKPFTFHRTVMALIDAPFLLNDLKIVQRLPSDVVSRALYYLKQMNNVTGAYTISKGHAFVRKDVADFITERDRINLRKHWVKTNSSGECPVLPQSNPENIVITDGSSAGVRMWLQILLDGTKDACMIPVPQYPLYSALITLQGAVASPYYLNEEEGWGVSVDQLKASYENTVRTKGATPRCIVVINPGNPTGQVLDRSLVESIAKFAHDNKILLIADEVYQENIYDQSKTFHSFREVILSLPEPYRSQTMLVSMQTVSKGLIGECGRRGGYFEYINLPKTLLDAINKLISINLCSNVNGQLMVSLMCRPPKHGEASFALYKRERDYIYQTLKRKAAHTSKELNKIPGFSCNAVEGAMYAFPTIILPTRYVKYNEECNARDNTKMEADARYCLELLEKHGIVIVPGSGFKQKEGTFHFRTTILPPEKEMKRFTESVRKFHLEMLKKYDNQNSKL